MAKQVKQLQFCATKLKSEVAKCKHAVVDLKNKFKQANKLSYNVVND